MKKFTFQRQDLAKLAPTAGQLSEFLEHSHNDLIERAFDMITMANHRGHYVFPQDPQKAILSVLTPRINVRNVCSWAQINYRAACSVLSRHALSYQNGLVVTSIDDVLMLAPKNADARTREMLGLVFQQLEHLLNSIGSIIMEWRQPAYFECQQLLDDAGDAYERSQHAKDSMVNLVNDAMRLGTNSYPTAESKAFAKQAAYSVVATHTNDGTKYLDWRGYEECYRAASRAVRSALKQFAWLDSKALSFVTV